MSPVKVYVEGEPSDEQIDELLDALLGPEEEDEAGEQPEEPNEPASEEDE